jgi:TolB protein
LTVISNRHGNWQVYVMEADGSNVRRLTQSRADEDIPTWSPDGREVTFVSNRDGHLEIYKMNRDGSNVRRLTNTQADNTWPFWAPVR